MGIHMALKDIIIKQNIWYFSAVFLFLAIFLTGADVRETQKKIKIFNPQSGNLEEVEPIIKSEVEWKKILTPEQFAVMRKKGTERPFSKQCAVPASGKGIYVCAGCGTALFAYENKFDSGTGWPSFWNPISPYNLKAEEDFDHGMHRTEVLCARCGAHLGHVFPDGPPPSGKRYCINTVTLKLAE